MFGISFYELLIILIISIVLFKPGEFISILFNLGIIIKKIKNFIHKLHDDIDKTVNLGNFNDYEVRDNIMLEDKKDLSKNKNNKL